MGSRSLSTLACLFTILFNIRLVSTTCYNPNGSVITSPAYQPCVQTVGVVSQCCGTNWTATDSRIGNDLCQPSGLCLNNNPANNQPLFWRGSCTDPTWKSPNCLANLCTSTSTGGDPTTNTPLLQCADGSWCCGSTNSTCCKNKLGVRINAIAGVSNTSSTSSTISSTSSSTLSSSTSISSGAANEVTPTASPSSSTQPDGPSISTGAKAGIGIGVGLLVVLDAALGTVFVLRRRRRIAAGPRPRPGPTELPANKEGSELEGFYHQEVGSHKPETFQHEVEGDTPVIPRAELADTRHI
ncbi:hypothetical protein B0J14DRAFT_596375 [Halenospora varia]|nr:hypothetical protein B0J14DRAFT_596375 [Halenospora varia]